MHASLSRRTPPPLQKTIIYREIIILSCGKQVNTFCGQNVGFFCDGIYSKPWALRLNRFLGIRNTTRAGINNRIRAVEFGMSYSFILPELPIKNENYINPLSNRKEKTVGRGINEFRQRL
jgi:hypothetical protein